jgi:hypothetical protein
VPITPSVAQNCSGFAALNKTLPVLVSETPMKSRVNRFGAGSSKRQ